VFVPFIVLTFCTSVTAAGNSGSIVNRESLSVILIACIRPSDGSRRGANYANAVSARARAFITCERTLGLRRRTINIAWITIPASKTSVFVAPPGASSHWTGRFRTSIFTSRNPVGIRHTMLEYTRCYRDYDAYCQRDDCAQLMFFCFHFAVYFVHCFAFPLSVTA